MRSFKAVLTLIFLVLGAKWLATQERLYKASQVWGITIADASGEWKFQSYQVMSEAQVSRLFRDRIWMNGKPIRHTKSRELAKHFLKECAKHRFDPAFVLSMIQIESSFRTDVVSQAGAVGLLQVMPPTAKYITAKKRIQRLSSRVDWPTALKDPKFNLTVGIAYLAYLRDHYEGRFAHMLAAFNAGPGRVKRSVPESEIRPVVTRPYIEAVRSAVPVFRTYGRDGRNRREHFLWVQHTLREAERSVPFKYGVHSPAKFGTADQRRINSALEAWQLELIRTDFGMAHELPQKTAGEAAFDPAQGFDVLPSAMSIFGRDSGRNDVSL